MTQLPVPCWTNEDIPPWGVFFVNDILNPLAVYAPTFVITRGAWDTLPVVAFPSSDHASWAAYNMRADVLTNGPAPIPAHSQFAARSLLTGVHWLAYSATSDPESTIFHPGELWALEDSEIPASIWPQFRRVGPADTRLRCVPVIMQPYFAVQEVI